MEVGIIGGGMMGLSLAYYLSRKGTQVTVFEKKAEIGGLSGSYELMPGVRWDRFYHVILSTDEALLKFIDDIDMSNEVHFRETKTGFYTDGALHSMSDTLEFLRFKPLSFLSKLRLGAGILYASRINDWKKLEEINARKWLTGIFGRKNYEKLWGPLLYSKLGTAKENASASFIWACIKRYYGTRQKGSKKEVMGCVRGGYHAILGRLKEKLEGSGVVIMVNRDVQGIEHPHNGKIGIRCSSNEMHEYDKVVFTVPNPEVIRFCPDINREFRATLEGVRYLSLACVTLLLRKPLSPFYVINLTDPGFPFTGVIEAANIMPTGELDDKGLVYLPRYMAPDDIYNDKKDEEIMDIFLRGLRRIFDGLEDQDVVARIVQKERYVQPIQVTGYSKNVPSMITGLRNIYMANSSMIVNSTLNNNEIVQLARKAADLVYSSA